MTRVLNVTFKPEGNDGRFIAVEFSTDGGLKPGVISKETLDLIDDHVANQRERNVIIRLEASRFMAREPNAALIVIDGVPEEMEPRFRPVPPLSREKVAQAIRTLRDLPRANTKFDIVMRYVDCLLQGAGTIASCPPWPFHCYRAVNYLTERATSTDQLGAPPTEKAPYGRCSPQGTPMFYCSFDQQVAMRELRVKAGDLVHLSAWKMTSPFVTFSMPPGRAPGQDVEAFAMLKSFINEVFTEKIIENAPEGKRKEDPSHRYMISAAFGSLYAHGRLDPMNPRLIYPLGGIYYQSVIDPSYENLAINAAIAATHLSLDVVFEMTVTGVTPEGEVETVLRGAGRTLSPNDPKQVTWFEDPKDPRLYL